MRSRLCYETTREWNNKRALLPSFQMVLRGLRCLLPAAADSGDGCCIITLMSARDSWRLAASAHRLGGTRRLICGEADLRILCSFASYPAEVRVFTKRFADNPFVFVGKDGLREAVVSVSFTQCFIGCNPLYNVDASNGTMATCKFISMHQNIQLFL